MSADLATSFSTAPLATSDGYVVTVRGAVVDVTFADDMLPPVGDALLVLSDDLAPVLAEVQAHFSEACWRVPFTALTIAEYFRDERHQNVLLLITLEAKAIGPSMTAAASGQRPRPSPA
ncbi:hypothetical protein P0D69_09545 [Paraburkholderia sediminicola]